MVAKITVASSENPREINEMVFDNVDEILHIEDRAKRIKLIVKKNQQIIGSFFVKDLRLVKIDPDEEEAENE